MSEAEQKKWETFWYAVGWLNASLADEALVKAVAETVREADAGEAEAGDNLRKLTTRLCHLVERTRASP